MADGPACFAQGFTCPALLGMPPCSNSRYPYGAVTLSGRPFQAAPVPHSRMSRGPTTPRAPRPARFGLVPFRSPLLGESLACFLLLPLLRCFSSRRSPTSRCRLSAGFPHSDTPGSTAVCASPGSFAACRVLHRLLEPGHPPCALVFFSSRGGPPQRPPRSLLS